MVFLAELVGDKTLLTICTLATRSRPAPLLAGVSVAFMGKMLAAVLLGRFIARLPGALVAGLTAVTFFAIALVIWLKRPEGSQAPAREVRHWSQTALAGFAAIFFSEWGDLGQITAATLAARYHAGLIVWIAATLALITKAILAMTAGVGLQRWVPEKILRYGALSLCLTMGFLSAFRIEL
jgi:putative Ca2+/H+ antiporter (TMEM165/GDT1 family)